MRMNRVILKPNAENHKRNVYKIQITYQLKHQNPKPHSSKTKHGFSSVQLTHNSVDRNQFASKCVCIKSLECLIENDSCDEAVSIPKKDISPRISGIQ